MNKRKTFLIILCCMAAFIPLRHSFAQLSWDDRQITSRPSPNDRQVDVEFKFVNMGSKDVEFISVKPSCGCTTAKMDKQVYRPNESGVVKATFVIGTRSGLQQKDIAVQTTDPTSPIAILTMRVFVPQVVVLSDENIKWMIGDDKSPKTIQINVMDHAFNVTSVSCTDDNFSCSLETIEAGKVYKVIVTPASTNQVDKATIRVMTDSPDKRIMHVRTSVSEM